ncbi:MAG: HD domain-containing protein [Aureliella sp.]
MTHANIDDALDLVVKHFRGVKDEDGEAYVMHCLRVMHGTSSPDAQLVGLMHDLIEDTPVTLDDLRDIGFSAAVIEGVNLVTHRDGDSYAEYVIKLKPNAIARDAKMSDLRDNASMNRVLYRETSTQSDAKRIQRYVLSYQFLGDRIDESTYRRLMADLQDESPQS